MTKKGIFTIVSLCLFFLIQGCGGGGEKTVITNPSQVVAFTGTTPGNNTVYMSQNSALSNGTTLAIDIKSNNISNAYGVAFDVDFDSSKITYDSYIAGSHLESGGETVNYFVSPQTGKLVVGISRLTGVASGSGTIVTLKFKSATSGTAQISFSNNEVRNADNQVVSGVSWSGGTASVIF